MTGRPLARPATGVATLFADTNPGAKAGAPKPIVGNGIMLPEKNEPPIGVE
jgi:hypothetical protein